MQSTLGADIINTYGAYRRKPDAPYKVSPVGTYKFDVDARYELGQVSTAFLIQQSGRERTAWS